MNRTKEELMRELETEVRFARKRLEHFGTSPYREGEIAAVEIALDYARDLETFPELINALGDEYYDADDPWFVPEDDRERQFLRGEAAGFRRALKTVERVSGLSVFEFYGSPAVA